MRLLVTTLGDNGFVHLAHLINSAPNVVPLAIDLHKRFFDMPFQF